MLFVRRWCSANETGQAVVGRVDLARGSAARIVGNEGFGEGFLVHDHIRLGLPNDVLELRVLVARTNHEAIVLGSHFLVFLQRHLDLLFAARRPASAGATLALELERHQLVPEALILKRLVEALNTFIDLAHERLVPRLPG